MTAFILARHLSQRPQSTLSAYLGTISTIDFILVTSDLQHLTTYPHLTYVKGYDHPALMICLTMGSVKVDLAYGAATPF